MALIQERIVSFLTLIAGLQSMPLFCVYLLMIALTRVWQRKVAPLNLAPVLIIHNFVCCFASLVTLAGFSVCVWATGSLYSRRQSESLSLVFWLYWLTKVIELLDTVFMILRHKGRQISFLHVYHHASMLVLSNLAYSYYPWPGIAVFLAMNSFVHVILYLYYGLTALFPDNPPTWKKQMTQVQILQFLVGFVIALYGYLHHSYCIYSILYGITMTWLFSNFYYHAYIKQRCPKKELPVNGKID